MSRWLGKVPAHWEVRRLRTSRSGTMGHGRDIVPSDASARTIPRNLERVPQRRHGPQVRATTAPDREVLAGLVERVTFHNPETGFCVLRIKARGHRTRGQRSSRVCLRAASRRHALVMSSRRRCPWAVSRRSNCSSETPAAKRAAPKGRVRSCGLRGGVLGIRRAIARSTAAQRSLSTRPAREQPAVFGKGRARSRRAAPAAAPRRMPARGPRLR